MLEPYVRITQYHETDQMGIINHINYIRWMEEARVDFMEKIGFGYEKAVDAGIDFALLGIRCQYKGMTRFREKVAIDVSIKALKPTRITVGYRMTGVSDGKLRFLGESDHCFFSAPKQRPVALTRDLPELYQILEQYVEKSK